MERFQNKYRIASARAQWWDYGWNGAYFITICTQNRVHFFGEIANGGNLETRLIASLPGQLAEKIWYDIPNQFPFVELGDFVVMPDHIHGILILNKPVDGIGGRNDHANDDGIGGGIGDGIGDAIGGGIGDAIGGGIVVETRLIASLPTTDPTTGPTTDRTTERTPGPTTDRTPDPTTDRTTDRTTERTPAQPNGQSFERFTEQIKTGGFAGNKNPMINENVSRIIRWYKGRCSFEIRKIQADFGWQARFYDHIICNDAEYQRISDYIINNPAKWKDDQFYSA